MEKKNDFAMLAFLNKTYHSRYSKERDSSQMM
jgi:hypothetical protein